ncbi:MAG: clostripain-related cysteine peptidase [Bacteroidota bacterium]
MSSPSKSGYRHERHKEHRNLRARGLMILCVLMLFFLAGCLPRAVRNWTFLVYMAADNNLDYFAGFDLQEMAAVGSNASLNIVVQHDPWDFGKPTQRLLVKYGSTATLASLGETNTGLKETLRDFLVWGVQRFPARNYALVLWNHGSGVWDPDAARSSSLPPEPGIHTQMIGVDDSANKDALTTIEYCQAIEEAEAMAGFHLNVLCFDACLMQMVEVAAELHDESGQPLVDYMVGSAANVPGDGYNYTLILDWLRDAGNASPDAFAARIVQAFGQTYPGENVTQSAIRLTGTAFAGLKAALAQLAAAINDADSSQKATVRAHAIDAADYDYGENTELRDFVSKLAADYTIPAIASKAAAVKSFLDGNGLVTSSYSGGNYAGLQGLAILLPTDAKELSYYGHYGELRFADTGWDAVIAAMAGS